MIDRIGEIKTMNCGLKAKIIKYKNCEDIDVQFEDGYIKKHVQYDKFKKGIIKNPYAITVYGIGFLGETKIVDESGIILKSYVCWRDMIKRCYDVKFQEKQPTYKGVTVCKEWFCYANFKKWYDEHIYTIENEMIQLDKDILMNESKIYSPDTCILVPRTINNLFRGYNKNKKELPKGISFHKLTNKYRVRFKSKYLGLYKTKEEAIEVYMEYSLREIRKIIYSYRDKIPNEVYLKLIENIDRMEGD